ncbi:S-layer homology domain-containing protein [Paenibacillus sp. NEAU-GSW1]|uniref:S-layer homology domain-containing protein n=1 Tax=Paenibacillus sp. NEAU-GSW1 TaxID=2682486 RepID=UPI0012E2F26D|nr:S-layer homology domain-containing protein [Paenibacillus sp. NEAU-GSW1]MUT68593.1 hypothetical protein [Paenibacillus sp. NEAU-GSW1]
MKRRSLLSSLAAITLLLPLIGTFATVLSPAPVNAAAASGKLMLSYQTYTNAFYTGTVTEFTYSSGGVVHQNSTAPATADWVTPSGYYDSGWNTNSWNEVYTYSDFGVISQTSNPASIPATAAWATISSFQVEDALSTETIGNTVFHYSINGTDVVTATDALDIPANALWASLVSFTDGWTQIQNEQFTSYSLGRTAPSVQSFTITSDSANPTYSKNGNTVVVMLQTDVPIAEPVLGIGGINMPVAGSGTSWSAVLTLSGAVSEGPLSVSASFYSLEGAPGPVQSGTTDGSAVYYDNTGPALSSSLSPAGATNANVTVEVTASDAGSGVALTKWAAGTQTAAYFLTQGTVFADSFTATANGTYSIYARDQIGNHALISVTVSGIDRTAPTVALSASTITPTNTDITVTAAAADNVAVSKLLWSLGTQTAAYFQAGNGTTFTDQFSAASNGTYSVYAEDTAGNYALTTLTVSNVFKQAPEITLTRSPEGPTQDSVYVGIEAQAIGEDEGNTLAALRWAEGEETAAFFAGGGGQDALADLEFEGDENGRYSVYARDIAGNETVSTIDIANIDRTAPTVTLTPDITGLTNEYVTVTVDAEDTGSGISEVLWSATEPEPDSPWPSSEVEDGEFIAESNGTYTVIAFDNAGNETIRQINVTNIITDGPALELEPETTEPAEKVTVSIEVSAVGAGNGIEAVLWAVGNLPVGFFREGISEDITAEMQFDATANGTYTVYARDLAGNETIETIDIDNIRSANADLAVLAVMTGAEEALSLSPAFAPQQLSYTLQAGSNVQSILLMAEAADGAASVTVNGKPLAAGSSTSVKLRTGVNTIRVVVTAELTSVVRTYIIEATREGTVSSGIAPNNVFIAELNGKETEGLNETIASGSDGTNTYDLKLDDASEIIALSQANGENELRIGPYGGSAPQIDAVTLTLSAKAQSQLKERNIKLTLDIGDALYELPAGSSADGGGELKVQLRALRQQADTEQLLSGAALTASREWKLKLAGVPIAFATNAVNTTTEDSLIVSLPDGFDAAALRKLAVFLESGVETKAIAAGTIRYDSKGQATGIAFDAGASGRAAVLQAEPVTVKYESYINGNADGSFAPSRLLTRAELAALIMKLSKAEGYEAAESSDAAVFSDVPQSHWAAEAIKYVSAAGWMNGGSGGLFRPNDTLTRGEMAAVLVRWREVEVSGSAGSQGSHWASEALSATEQLGWMRDYTDGTPSPDDKMTRAHAIRVLNLVFGRPSLAEGGPTWTDVPATHWAAGFIRSAAQNFEAHYYLSGEVELIVK